MADPLGLVTIANDLRARLDWREETLSIALITAESAIAYLYAGALLPEISYPYAPFPGLLLFGLLLLTYELPHLLDELRVWSPRYEAVLTVGVILSLLMTLKVAAFPGEPWLSTAWIRGSADGLILHQNDAVRPPWAIVGVIAYVWWRGRTRAEPMLETAYQMLRWGTLAAAGALLLILLAAPRTAPIHDRMPGAVVLYFAAALAAVGIGRLRLEGLRSGNPLGPHWLATFAVPIAGVTLVAILAASIFSRTFFDTLLLVLGPLFWLLGILIRAVIVLIALLAFIVIAPILWLIERHGLGRFPLADRLPRTANPFDQLDQFARHTLNISDPARYLLAGAVLFLLVSALTRYAYRRRRRWRESAQERRESVFAWDDAVGGLAQRLRRLFRPVRWRGDPLAALRGRPGWAHTVFIRETYIRLQDRGRRAGAHRAPSMTPDEYQPTVARRFPGAEREIATITGAYNAARYGSEPASARDAAAVRDAWEAFVRQHDTR